MTVKQKYYVSIDVWVNLLVVVKMLIRANNTPEVRDKSQRPRGDHRVTNSQGLRKYDMNLVLPPWMVTIRIRQEATFIFLGVWKTT